MPSWQRIVRISVILAVAISSAARADHGGGGHIEMFLSVPATSNTGDYTVTWVTNEWGDHYLQEKVGSGSYSNVYSGTAESKSFTGKADGTYTYRIKWVDCFFGCSTYYTEPESIVVENLVDMSLSSPASSDTGNFVVTWSNPSSDEDSLEERFNGGMWSEVYFGEGDTKHFSGLANGTYEYRVKRTVGAQTETSFSTTTVVATPTPEPIQSTSIVGLLPYSAGVTNNGNAYVNIPIRVAPGINGFQPGLAISYNSGRDRQLSNEQRARDILGYGWNISGLSTISRCVKGQTNSNQIDLDTSDDICFNGEPLVLVSGTHWSPGAEYRTYRESFHKIVLQGTTSAPWFKVYSPDGSVSEFGNTEDSRLHSYKIVVIGPIEEEVVSEPYLWSINEQVDPFGNVMTFTYNDDELAGTRHPISIEYGNSDDAKVVFEYEVRDDVDEVTLASETIQNPLLLHTIRVELDSKTVREYRLDSVAPTSEDWRRLESIQMCGYDINGSNPECLPAMEVEWDTPSTTWPELETFVDTITDTRGMVTQFTHDVIPATGSASFQFTETPFGTVSYSTDVEVPPATNGFITAVVTEVKRSDGLGGWHTTSYAYYGTGRQSKENWGFVGFPATRETDETSGIITYRQHRLHDDYYVGEVSAVHQYDAVYGTGTPGLLACVETELDVKSISHGGAYTYLPYKKTITTRLQEGEGSGATTIGAVQVTNSIDIVSGFIDDSTTTTVVGTVSGPTGGNSFWGDVPTYSFTTVDRTVVADQEFTDLTTGSDWTIGFMNAATIEHWKGSVSSGTKSRTQDSEYTREGTTNAVKVQTDFPNHAEYTLTTTNTYGSTGLITSRVVVGDNVASRTNSFLNFSDGRYATKRRNPLTQDTNLSFDHRFGYVTTTTDPNERQTSLQFDVFGREVSRTTPDGVDITTSYDDCAVVSCASVGSIAPVSRIQVETNNGTTQVAPLRNEYLDLLGRVIRSEVESFSGTMIRVDTKYDTLGRVDETSQPYLAGGTQYFTEFDYDIRNRVTAESRADGSSTEIDYTVESGVGIRRTATDNVLKSNGSSHQTQVNYKIYNRTGEVVESVDDAGTGGKAVKTTYTYDGAGQPDTVTVDDGGAELETSFTFDDGGYRKMLVGPDIGTIASTYTALGEPLMHKHGTGTSELTTTFTHDKLGRLTQKQDPDDTATWTYDTATNAVGLLASKEYGSSSEFTETFYYGSDSRVSKISTNLQVGSHNKTFDHEFWYDSSGRLDKEKMPSGIEIENNYNARGYLQSVEDTATSSALTTYTTIDAYGNVESQSFGNGLSTARTFDAKTGRLTGIDTTKTGATFQDHTYEWLSNGILESRIKVDGATTLTETFSYDALNRLTSALTKQGTTAVRTLTSNYDDRGNLQYKQSDVSGDIDVTGYQYATGKNQLSDVTIGGVAVDLDYDVYGNVERYDRASGEDTYIAWNGRQLPAVITVGGNESDTTPTARDSFLYGPDGQRFYKKTEWMDGTDLWTEETFYVGTFEERILDSKDTTDDRVQRSMLGDSVLHIKVFPRTGSPTESIEYLHRDHLGSVEVVTDASGNELEVLAYDPFGERRKSDWLRALTNSERLSLADDLRKDKTSRGYTGHEHLDRTGFVHMNGRVYDPQLGRFLSPDPMVQASGYSQSWNRYSYVLNSPASYTDPSGHYVDGPICNGHLIMCMNDDSSNAGAGQWSPKAIWQKVELHTREVIAQIEKTYFFEYGGANDAGLSGYIEIVAGYWIKTVVTEARVDSTVMVPDTNPNEKPMEESSQTGLPILLDGLLAQAGAVPSPNVILPPIDTDEGLLARVLIAESRTPFDSNYNGAEVFRALQMISAVYQNRLSNPSLFGAPGAQTLSDVILGAGQTQGFSRDTNGNVVISSRVQSRINTVLATANSGPPGRFSAFVNRAIGIANGTLPSTDPFAGVQSVGGTAISGGVYGYRTAGSSHPGGSFVAIPASLGGVVAGHQFYGVRP